MEIIYEFNGKVQKGAQRGRLLGFPTANIPLQEKIPEGIYISQIIINPVKSGAEWYPAATFIGSAKTFHETDYKAEIYILNFDDNIYGMDLHVKLFRKIRDNQRFDSEEELIKQMKKDIEGVKKYFEQIN